jgi:glutamyl-tRNA reductase
MRQAEACDAEEIVAEEMILLKRSIKQLEVEPIISKIRISAENIRKLETQKAFKMLGDMNGNEKVVENLTKVVVERIFNDVIRNLKKAAEDGDESTIKAAETLFNNKMPEDKFKNF